MTRHICGLFELLVFYIYFFLNRVFKSKINCTVKRHICLKRNSGMPSPRPF